MLLEGKVNNITIDKCTKMGVVFAVSTSPKILHSCYIKQIKSNVTGIIFHAVCY